jgi:hypothetical protein
MIDWFQAHFFARVGMVTLVNPLASLSLITLCRNVFLFEDPPRLIGTFCLVSIPGACCIRHQCSCASFLLPGMPRHGSGGLRQSWKKRVELIRHSILSTGTWTV